MPNLSLPPSAPLAVFSETPVPLNTQGEPIKIISSYKELMEFLKQLLKVPLREDGKYQPIYSDEQKNLFVKDASEPDGIKKNEKGLKVKEPGHFSCPAAAFFGLKIHDYKRKEDPDFKLEGQDFNNFIHRHNPKFTKDERTYAIERIKEEIFKGSKSMDEVLPRKNEGTRVYGDASNKEKQITYTKQEDGTWLITAGKQANAVIIDPAGKMIEIHGDHMHVYGEGGNLKVPKDLERPDHNLEDPNHTQHRQKAGHVHSASCGC